MINTLVDISKQTGIADKDIIVFYENNDPTRKWCTVQVISVRLNDSGSISTIIGKVLDPGLSEMSVASTANIEITDVNKYSQIIPALNQKPSTIQKRKVSEKSEIDKVLDVGYRYITNFDKAQIPIAQLHKYLHERGFMASATSLRGRQHLRRWLLDDTRFDIRGKYVRALSLDIARQKHLVKNSKVAVLTDIEETINLDEGERLVDVSKVLEAVVLLLESGLLGKAIPINIPKKSED